jgi:hypothetical protein
MMQVERTSEDSIGTVDGLARGPRVAFAPGAVRYIKLGERGRWARQAIEEGYVPFDYRPIEHEACVAGNWQIVERQLAAMGRDGRTLGRGLREIQEFHQLPADTLWVTLADRNIWWTFAPGPVIATGLPSPHPPRLRRSLNGWSNTSLSGKRLVADQLSSALTSTFAYSQTICAVKAKDYLLRLIRDEPDPALSETNAVLASLAGLALAAIRHLHQSDLELMVDMLLMRTGWLRISELGKSLPDVDLIVENPLTRERGWVQVKARARQAEFNDYLQRFRADGSCRKFFFICPDLPGLTASALPPDIHLLAGEELAAAVIRVGLLEWVMQRAR